jgi:CubicO group peptidase (beta-lactamase class C family)
MKKLLPLLLLLACTSVYAQPLASKAIDELSERSMKAFDVPGIAVAVIKDGKVIHSKGYGVRSLKTMEKVDENTLFGIASNSKAFTAATLGILVDEGKIKWDDKVRDYIPEFKLYSPFVTEEFTIRDLLTHRSGMGLGAGDLMFFPDSSDFTLKDVIYNLRFLKSVSSFRTKYDYDNNLYIVAGEVVSRVTGKSWDEFVEQRIIQPLGMTKTAASFDRLKDKSNVIDGHAAVEGKVRVIARSTVKVAHAAGGLNSNIADLSKWVLLHLNHGKYGDNLSKRLFSDDVHEEMWTPQTIIPIRNPGPYNVHFAGYGLGFFLNDVKGYKQISHTGGLEGMVTQITMIPELSLGIIVLTNQQEGGAFSSITNQIKDAYFGITGTDRVKEYSANRNKAIAGAKHLMDSIWSEIDGVRKAGVKTDWNAVVGTYTDAWFGDVTIAIKNGKLWFDSKRSPKLTGEMFAYKGNTFVVKWKDRSMDADAYVNFSLDETGKGAGITMKAISPLTDFSYDFHDLNFKKTK